MAVTLNGIRGSNAGPGAVERLGQLDKDRSVAILDQLKSDLNGKSGVLRLLHTSKDTDMKFKNADAMKHFASGSKLDRTGEAVRELLVNAGLSGEALKSFDAYRAGRAGKGLGSQQVVRYIEMLRAETGGSPAEVLGKIGIAQPGANDLLGAGAFGKVSNVVYRGNPCVLKELFESADSKLPQINLEGMKGKFSPDKMGKTAFMDAVAEYHGGKKDFPPELLKEVEIYAKGEAALNGGKLNKMPEDQRNIFWKWYLASDDDRSDSKKPQAPKTRLERNGEAAAAWMKSDIKHVVKPSVYVVRETDMKGVQTFHAVPGGKFLKTWAAEKLRTGQPVLEISGLVMERAKGKQLVADDDFGLSENRFVLFDKISSSNMKNVARSGLEALKELASHGFVHGDIKPANMIFDSGSGNVTLIDFSGLQKMSKKGGSIEVGAMSQLYLLPDGAERGPARDLFAMGMSIVEAGLKARGRHADASEMGSVLFERNSPKGMYDAERMRSNGAAGPEAWEETMERLAAAEPQGSAVAFGFACMRQAAAWDSAKFGRYDAATSPPDHPLNVLARHPAVAG